MNTVKKMKKVTYNEKRNLIKEYPPYMSKITVTDFESACRRCEQEFVNKVRMIRARKTLLYRMHSIKAHKYVISYAEKMYRLSRSSQKKFCSIMKNKYGSVKNYWNMMR